MNYWETERIRLRGLEPKDAALFHAWNNDSDMARNLDFLLPPSSVSWRQKLAGRSHQKKD